MTVIFELNNKENIFLDKGKIKLKRNSFPIKVKLINNKGRDTDRIIYIREKNGVAKMQLS
jgi:hypothetical protein